MGHLFLVVLSCCEHSYSCLNRHFVAKSCFIEQGMVTIVDWRLIGFSILIYLPVAFWPYLSFQYWNQYAVLVLASLIVGSLVCVISSFLYRGQMNAEASFVFSLASFVVGVATFFSSIFAATDSEHSGFRCNDARSGLAGLSLENCTAAPLQHLVSMILLASLLIPAMVFLGSVDWYDRHRRDSMRKNES